MRKPFRKSIVANTDIKKGTSILPEMLAIKRPETGISPKYFNRVIGKKAKRNIKYDDLITQKDISW